MALLLPVTRQGLRGGFTIWTVAESYLTANANASKAIKSKKKKKKITRHCNLEIPILMSNYSLCVISALLSIIDV